MQKAVGRMQKKIQNFINLLEQKIGHLPTQPGVYLFKDRQGTILYVGKAGNIRHRVRSYFQKPSEKGTKTSVMLEKVADIETIVTDTEKEALILEDNLVKEHHPRYNVKLRDDKRYPCLRLSVEEEFPTLSIVRKIKKDRSLYFGPYSSATSLRETLKLIRRIFPIRTCHHTRFLNRIRPCINYEMRRCSGPCSGQIEHSKKVIEKQKIVARDFVDQDVIGFHREDQTVVIHPLFVRAGKLQGGRGFTVPSMGLPDEEVLSSFLRQYYREDRFIPERILIPKSIPEQDLAEEWLTKMKGKKVRILVPRKGDKKELLQMACDNAEKFLIAKTDYEEERGKLLEALKERLNLNRTPKRIEAFDISNLQGGDAVGSMVSLKERQPAKERYRHFRIKTVE